MPTGQPGRQTVGSAGSRRAGCGRGSRGGRSRRCRGAGRWRARPRWRGPRVTRKTMVVMAVNLRLATSCRQWQSGHRSIHSCHIGGIPCSRTSSASPFPQMAPFEFGVICEVFGIDRSEHGGPDLRLPRRRRRPGPVAHEARLRHRRARGPRRGRRRRPHRRSRVPASTAPPDERVLDVIRDAEARGAWVLSVCSGAFTLGQAGILDGRRGDHPLDVHRPARRAVPRRPTSTPTCSSCRTARSSRAPAPPPASTPHCTSCAPSSAPAPPTSSPAAWSCRRSATAGSRSSSRRRCPSATATRSPKVTEWMLEHLDQDLTVDLLARKALMSPRTFARRFRAETGHHADRLAQPPAPAARAAAARGDRRSRSRRSRARPASAPQPSCATTSSRCCRPRRRRTAHVRAPRGELTGRRHPPSASVRLRMPRAGPSSRSRRSPSPPTSTPPSSGVT